MQVSVLEMNERTRLRFVDTCGVPTSEFESSIESFETVVSA
jgi:hypothetical protein